MVLDVDGDVENEDLRHVLVAACTVMGTSFPEYDEWYQTAVKEAWGWRYEERERIRKNFVDSDDEDDLDDEEWDIDEEWDVEDEEDEDFDGVGFGGEPYALPPFRQVQPRVGRNDPCPCGSGKKYKKCCGRK